MVELQTAIDELNSGKIEFDYKDDCCTTEGEVVILLRQLGEMEQENKNLQADKEALIAGQETLQKYISEKESEIERLQGLFPENTGIFVKVGDGVLFTESPEKYDQIIGEIFASAVEEFIARMKEEYRDFDAEAEEICLENLFKCLDDVAEEMKGGKESESI